MLCYKICPDGNGVGICNRFSWKKDMSFREGGFLENQQPELEPSLNPMPVAHNKN